MCLVKLQFASGVSGTPEALAHFGDNESQQRIERQSAATETTIRKFTENSKVNRALAALESELARAQSDLRVVANRSSRIDNQLLLCSCSALINSSAGNSLRINRVSYSARYTNDGQLVVTNESEDWPPRAPLRGRKAR